MARGAHNSSWCSSARRRLLAALLLISATASLEAAAAQPKGACGAALSPCGTAAGCADASCPSGYYCAAAFDSGAGDRCIQLPPNAGKAGGPCLPSNLPGAPTVASKQLGRDVAAPHCSGTAVCFAPIGGDTIGFTFNKSPSEAKKAAARIKGTKCVEVPGDCGSGAGKPCCYSGYNMVTDKPLPSAAWGGDACGDGKAKLYCTGNYSPLSSEPLGKCAVNSACGGPGQPCCKYSRADMGGKTCPNLGGPGAGYCNLESKCRLCPPVAYKVEDMLRCI